MIYYHDGGISEFFWRRYFDKYVRFDPITTGHFFADIEEPISAADLMPYDEFLETRFYKEWARPQGLVDVVASVLDKSVTGAALFGVFRHERDGIANDETRRRMRLIVPHIRRAMVMGRLVELKTAEAATFTATLDRLSAGMCLIGADGSIVHANVAFQTILATGDYLSVIGDRLVANDMEADHTLQELLSDADSRVASIDREGVALSLKASDGSIHIAHVLPLTCSTKYPAGSGATAVAALFVHKTELDVPAQSETIARQYKLTPTELRVLFELVKAGGVPEIANALGIAHTTVKTHLGKLFAKTGASRQADLIRIVAGYATPFLN
jgi:DNA-binding CsgD family transcriptional regulator